jgi:uncharacterized protein YtpQ (UPF0354 family)
MRCNGWWAGVGRVTAVFEGGHAAMGWSKRVLLTRMGLLSMISWFTSTATADARRFSDIKDLRAAFIKAVRRKPGVTGAVPDAADPAKVSVRADGHTYAVDLTNLMSRIRAYPDDDPDKLIAEFVAAMNDTRARSVSDANLVAVLRNKAYVDQITKMKLGLLTEPLVGDLVIVYMADLPGSMSPVAGKEFPKKSSAELHGVALGNVRKWLGHVKSDAKLQIATLYFVEGNTLLSPTLILLDEFWASIAGRHPGDVLIAVPRRDQLFILDDDARGRAMARRLIDVTFQDNFNLLSDRIFARRGGKIVAVQE